MQKLGSRFINNNAKATDSPFIFTLFKKCQKYGIPYDLMCTLNYHDLLYLIVEYDIELVTKELNKLQEQKNHSRGIQVINATNEDILNMHKRV